MKVLLIDNDDSFTWNLAQQIGALGADCSVRSHHDLTVEKIRKMHPDRIVISAGPGHPKDAKLSNDLLRSYLDPPSQTLSPIPVLGVCLGHQCIAHVFGGASAVGHAPEVRHGKTSMIFHEGRSIFKDIPSPFPAARYHSLIVKKLPKDFELLCWTHEETREESGSPCSNNRIIMGMRHKTLPIVGVQFHPESFLTEYGDRLMANFLHGLW